MTQVHKQPKGAWHYWSTPAVSAGVAFCILTTIIVLLKMYPKLKDRQEANYTLCSTSPCKAYSKILNDSMSPTVDACQDFYEHICGGRLKRNDRRVSFTSLSIQMRAQSLHPDMQERMATRGQGCMPCEPICPRSAGFCPSWQMLQNFYDSVQLGRTELL